MLTPPTTEKPLAPGAADLEAAGVDGQRLVDAVLGAEEGGGMGGRDGALGVRAREIGGDAVAQLVQAPDEALVGGEARFARHSQARQ